MVGVKRRIGCADGGEMCDVADLYLGCEGAPPRRREFEHTQVRPPSRPLFPPGRDIIGPLSAARLASSAWLPTRQAPAPCLIGAVRDTLVTRDWTRSFPFGRWPRVFECACGRRRARRAASSACYQHPRLTREKISPRHALCNYLIALLHCRANIALTLKEPVSETCAMSTSSSCMSSVYKMFIDTSTASSQSSV